MLTNEFKFRPMTVNSDAVIFDIIKDAIRIENIIKKFSKVSRTDIVQLQDNGYIIKYYIYATGWHTLKHKYEYESMI